jgi:protein tyrosine phosphatase (PTP) superfamily phosphohydrolase (DUF442 family)
MTHFALNYYEFRGRVGTAGQPTRDQLEAICRADFHSVINLSTPDTQDTIPDEGSIVTGNGLNYFQVPVPFERPEPAHFHTFMGLMNAIEGKNVFVHCGANLRVSAFMFHYLQLTRGYTPEEASSPILRAWLPRIDPVWKRFLETDFSERVPQ